MPDPEPASTLIFRKRKPAVDRAEVRRYAAAITAVVSEGRPFTVLLAGDKDLQELNRQFLQHDYPTDVLSFPAPEGSDTIGDLAISLHRAAAQATDHGHTIEEETGILMLHGVLHLLGYDHEVDRGRMRRVEVRYRKSLNLPSGLIERSKR